MPQSIKPDRPIWPSVPDSERGPQGVAARRHGEPRPRPAGAYAEPGTRAPVPTGPSGFGSFES